MGGRGALGHNFEHKTKGAIIDALRSNGIRISTEDSKLINKHNRAMISRIAEEAIKLKKEFGYGFDAIRLESLAETAKGRPSPTSVMATAHYVGGLSHLIIRLNTHKKSLRDMDKLLRTAHGKNNVATKNIREVVRHEYGHVLHKKLKYKNPVEYKKLNKTLDELHAQTGRGKKSKVKIKVSGYATKFHTQHKSHQETIAESMVHIISNRRSRGGSDTVKAVRSAFEKARMIKKVAPKVVSKATKSTPTKPNTGKKTTLKEKQDNNFAQIMSWLK